MIAKSNTKSRPQGGATVIDTVVGLAELVSNKQVVYDCCESTTTHSTPTLRQGMRLIFNMLNTPSGRFVTPHFTYTVVLPISDPVTIDWGDNTTSSTTNHIYSTFGSYTVEITGDITSFGSGSAYPWPGVQWLTSIPTWGPSSIVNLSGAFAGATSLTSLPSTLPTSVTNVSYMFADISGLYTAGLWNNTVNISGWATDSIIDKSYFFSPDRITDTTAIDIKSPFYIASPSMPLTNSLTSTSISLTWSNAATNPTNTMVQYSTSPSGGWSSPITVSYPGTSVTVTNLLPETAYYFRIYTTKNGLSSLPITTSTTASTRVAQPSGLTANNATTTSISLSWINNTDNPTNTVVEYTTSLSGSWTTHNLFANGSATTITVTPLESGVAYYFRVYTVKGSLTSMPSTPSSVVSTLENPFWNSVVTVAGGTNGYADGVGTSARFDNPQDIVSDSSGNIYVADTNGNRIRKINTQGVMTTIAGSGSTAFADGTGIGASFNRPKGIAVDIIGNIYVADTYNYRIRKITPGGVVTTLAGSQYGFADGTGTGASFSFLNEIAIYNATGDLFVADEYRIRRVTQGGVVSLLAGTTTLGYQEGTGAGANFSLIKGIAIASDGTLIVTDSDISRIRTVTQQGVTALLAGSGGRGQVDGTGGGATLNQPSGIAFESGGTSLIFADNGTHVIRRVTYPGGVVTTIAGSGLPGADDGPVASATFQFPRCLAVGAGGNVLIGHGFTTSNSSYIRAVIKTASQAPTGLTTSNPTLTSITLSWTNNSTTLTDTLVEYQPASGSWTTFTHNPLGSGNSITVTGLNSGTTYSFRVSSTVYGVTVAGPSATASGTTTEPPAPPSGLTTPSQPTITSVIPGDSSVALTWTVPVYDGGTSILRYYIRVINATGSILQIINTQSTSLSYTVTGLVNGLECKFTVAAVNIIGVGPYSSETSTVTPIP